MNQIRNNGPANATAPIAAPNSHVGSPMDSAPRTVSPAATQNAGHTSRVGTMRVRKSMTVMATPTGISHHTGGSRQSHPMIASAASARAGTASSTKGWNAGIGVPQDRHLPRSASHDTTGMLSYHLRGASQWSQRLLPANTSDHSRVSQVSPHSFGSSSSTGSRTITTLVNDPIAKNARTAKTTQTVCAAVNAANNVVPM